MDTHQIESFVHKHNYPLEYYKLVELGLFELKPWNILYDERLQLKFDGLKERYPKRKLIPFALRTDCDDVACVDLDNGKIIIIHDYSSEGWEHRAIYQTFWDWFHKAVNDMIDFAKEDIEYERKSLK